VPNFATLTAPLTELTKQNKRQIVWTAECADALIKIQQILSLSPVLLLPRVDQQFIVRTDASSVGVGAVLMQESHGDIHPVLYASRKLLEREQRYSTIERECLAIIWAISKFAKYLWGTYFVLQTDHKPLVYLRTSSFKNSRLMRWALALQEFTFEIESLPGSANVLADLLSRSCADQMIS
jgi:phospholipid-translocating ATPase